MRPFLPGQHDIILVFKNTLECYSTVHCSVVSIAFLVCVTIFGICYVCIWCLSLNSLQGQWFRYILSLTTKLPITQHLADAKPHKTQFMLSVSGQLWTCIWTADAHTRFHIYFLEACGHRRVPHLHTNKQGCSTITFQRCKIQSVSITNCCSVIFWPAFKRNNVFLQLDLLDLVSLSHQQHAHIQHSLLYCCTQYCCQSECSWGVPICCRTTRKSRRKKESDSWIGWDRCPVRFSRLQLVFLVWIQSAWSQISCSTQTSAESSCGPGFGETGKYMFHL